MERIQKIGLGALVVLLLVVGAIILQTKSAPPTVMTPARTTVDDTLWNAYGIGDALFVYPSDWELSPTYDTDGEMILGFTTSTTDTEGVHHSVTVHLGCQPELNPIYCVQGYEISKGDTSAFTTAVFDYMRQFAIAPIKE